MRAIVILSVILVGAFAATTLEKQLIRDVFNQWKVANGKSYKAGHEEEHRFNVFLKNYVTIQTHNQKKTGVTLALNQFADLTSEEFTATHTGLIHHKKTHATHTKTAKVGDLAASVDWRTKGAVTPVKNQLACGSCWAFSAVGALEGLYFIEKGTLESFSEQQLVDCDPKSYGCNGGWMDYAFEYVAGHGIERGSDYPYTAKTGKCVADDSKAIKFTTGFVDVPAKNADALKAAIAHQPVSVAIQANQSVFQFYRSGVITTGCGASLNHGVLAVGYNTFDDKEAYIVKNSWGTVWGDKGYVLIGTDPSQNGGAGVCGILSVSSYPK